jgi:DNA-binding SARP family transcriptional activator
MAVLDFGILGPLRVELNERLIRVGPRKHRILLASLLVRVNRPVHLDELIDRLWPTAPPAGARRTVQTYAMRLRRQLGAAGELVRTHPEAYSIELSAEQLDVTRFVRLTERAARARVAGRVCGARDLLQEALAQWRGQPLADVPSTELCRVEIPRLVELRCRAIEERVDLDLQLGPSLETGDIVGELRALVAEYPLRERFWVLLMRALRQAGRPAEALAAYHEADRLLGDELGTEPGQELRRLHAEILGGTPSRPAVVRRELRRLHDLLAEALRLVVVVSEEES